MSGGQQNNRPKRPNLGRRGRRRSLLYVAIPPVVAAAVLLSGGQVVMDHAKRTGHFTANIAHCIDCANDAQCSLNNQAAHANKGESVPANSQKSSDTWAPAEYVELTSDMLGKELKEGVRYKVTKDLTFDGRPGGTAGIIANNNVIYIVEGVTLTCYGADAKGSAGGKPGIQIVEGKTLALLGAGKVHAEGGNASYGLNGQQGQKGECQERGSGRDTYFGGSGGQGGQGGGGAGAGIGGPGGEGGAGGEPTQAPNTPMYRDDANQSHGNSGKAGQAPASPDKGGSLYVVGKVAVEAIGGGLPKEGNRPLGGSQGWREKKKYFGQKYLAGGGGGGGGGGAGGAANGIGAGGCGGAGGGSGGTGGAIWRGVPFFDVQPNLAPMGGGGAGGASASGVPDKYDGLNGFGARTEVIGYWGGSGGTTASRDKMVSWQGDASNIMVWSPDKSATVQMNRWDNLSMKTYSSGDSQFLSWVTSTKDFAKAKNNAGWYVNNTISLDGGKIAVPGKADGATEISFFSIIDLTKPDALRDQIEDAASLVKKDGSRFAGFKLGGDFASDELLYDPTSAEFNQDLLAKKGIIRQNANSEWVWATGKNVPIIAQWEALEETYTITFDANGGSFVDAKTGAAVSETKHSDSSYKKETATPLWDNNGIGAYKLVKPKEAADNVKLLGWAQSFTSDGRPIRLYPLGSKVKRSKFAGASDVTLYAVWGTEQDQDAMANAIEPSDQ